MANQLIVFMKVENVLEFKNDKGQLVAKALLLGDVENTFKEFDHVHASIPMELDTDEAKALYMGKFVIYKGDKVRYPKSNKTENGWKSDRELVLRGSVALVLEAEHVKMIVQPNFPTKFKALMDEGVFNQS